MGVADYSTTPASNTSINGVNIDEGCLPSGINNALRQLMADVRSVYDLDAKSSNYTVVTSDLGKTFLADASGGAFTLSLPATSTLSVGFEISIIKTDSSTNAITLDPDGSETINGETSVALNVQYQKVTIATNSANQWYIKSGGIDSHEMLVPAQGIQPSPQNGCSALSNNNQASTAATEWYLRFDASANEHAQISFPTPDDYNGGTIEGTIFWGPHGSSGGAVVWQVRATVGSTGWGSFSATSAVSSSSPGALLVTPLNSVVTPGGSPGPAKMMFVQIQRAASSGSDTNPDDARLYGVKLKLNP